MNWIEICTSQTQGTCPSSLLFQTMCGDRARSVHCNSYILLALKISGQILVKVKKLTTDVLKSECLGHFTLIKIVSFLSYFVIFRKKKCFITSILKSLLILAIWSALSTIICFRITLSFAQSEFCQALSIWQNRKWTAPKKHPTIIHWHIWSLNFISRTFDGMWVGFHNRKYDQSEKSKICPKDHL